MDRNERDILTVIDQVEEWQAKSSQYEPVVGGKTNLNWKVLVEGKAYFVKIPGIGTEAFIDRQNCHQANLIAQKTGIGPRVVRFFDDSGVEIFEWIEDGAPVKFGDVFEPEKLHKMIDVARKFHACKEIELPLVQTAFEQTADMIKMARALKGYVPDEIDRMEWLVERIHEAVMTAGIDYVPCHNDLWSANFVWLKAKREMMLLDYEYASMNDACYDLGIWSAVNYFTEAMDYGLIQSYYGRPDEEKLARLKLYKILQDIKWAMWSCVQAVNSPVSDYDYFEWLGTKMARLRNFWNDPRLDYWFTVLNHRPN